MPLGASGGRRSAPSAVATSTTRPASGSYAVSKVKLLTSSPDEFDRKVLDSKTFPPFTTETFTRAAPGAAGAAEATPDQRP